MLALVIILVVAIFSLLVFVHEFGHFVMARRAGIKVEEFGFGFPPRLWGRRGKDGVVYSVNWLPLGGFVKMKGEDSADTSPGSFGAARFAAKTRVLLAGVGMNALVAYVIILALCWTGLPPLLANQFSVGDYTYAQPKQLMMVSVEPGSPAQQAGIREGDLVLGGNGQTFTQEDQLVNFTKDHAGQTVDLVISHAGQARSVNVRLNPPGSSQGYLGVVPFQTDKIRYTWSAPIVAAGLLLQLGWATIAAFGGLLAGLLVHARVSDHVAGPVGIVAILSNVVHLGVSYVAVFVASISLSLAVINVLPLPALDGGRFALAAVQRVFKRALPARVENIIHLAGFAALLILMAIITIVDIQRLHG